MPEVGAEAKSALFQDFQLISAVLRVRPENAKGGGWGSRVGEQKGGGAKHEETVHGNQFPSLLTSVHVCAPPPPPFPCCR